MAEELIPNDTPEIAKLKACESYAELLLTYDDIFCAVGYKHFSDTYKAELTTLFLNLLSDYE